MDLRGKPFYLSEAEERWVLDTLAGMSEREKTGQLFCVMGGDYALGELCSLVRDEGIGAVLYRPCPKAELEGNDCRYRRRGADTFAPRGKPSRKAVRAASRTAPALQTSSPSPLRTTRTAPGTSQRSAPRRALRRA